MHIIENDFLKVAIQEKGAELTSIFSKPLGLEYMWNGDPAFWPKHSPVLFPVVGALKNNTYFFRNRQYELPRHGFAREKAFSVAGQSPDNITFSLSNDEETMLVYPFEFELNIYYRITENILTVTYEVKNRGSEEMYFSIGGHPAFKVPLLNDTSYEDYYLEFNRKENSQRWRVSPDGLIDEGSVPVFSNDSIIPLKKELFSEDALVFKDLVSDRVSLKCNKHPHGLDFDFPFFPYMGIWAAKNADFVCIEPWCGIADGVYTDQQLKNKEGINKLGEDETFRKEWKLTIW
jgi:galactose mutarotase-like enzyme